MARCRQWIGAGRGQVQAVVRFRQWICAGSDQVQAVAGSLHLYLVLLSSRLWRNAARQQVQAGDGQVQEIDVVVEE